MLFYEICRIECATWFPCVPVIYLVESKWPSRVYHLYTSPEIVLLLLLVLFHKCCYNCLWCLRIGLKSSLFHWIDGLTTTESIDQLNDDDDERKIALQLLNEHFFFHFNSSKKNQQQQQNSHLISFSDAAADLFGCMFVVHILPPICAYWFVFIE